MMILWLYENEPRSMNRRTFAEWHWFAYKTTRRNLLSSLGLRRGSHGNCDYWCFDHENLDTDFLTPSISSCTNVNNCHILEARPHCSVYLRSSRFNTRLFHCGIEERCMIIRELPNFSRWNILISEKYYEYPSLAFFLTRTHESETKSLSLKKKGRKIGREKRRKKKWK